MVVLISSLWWIRNLIVESGRAFRPYLAKSRCLEKSLIWFVIELATTAMFGVV
jgi:hypothetical protein